MKRYFNFMRSGATISLAVLYVLTTLFSFSLVNAEEETNTFEEDLYQSLESYNDSQGDEIVVEEGVSFGDESPKEDFSQDDSSQEESTNDQSEEVVEVAPATTLESRIEENPVFVCEEVNSPEITMDSYYADLQSSETDPHAVILAQVNPLATDPEDGTLSVENNLSSFDFSTSGWHEVTFTATDSTGCVTTETISVFVFDTDYAPSCEIGSMYMNITIPGSYVAALGSNTQIESGQWFPVMYDGHTLAESEHDITIPHDISVARIGSSVFINIGTGVVDGDIVAQQIVDSIELKGARIASSNIFSGNVAIIELEPEDCPVCSASNGPVFTSVLHETVTINENTSLTVDEILNSFGMTTEDLDGEGLVTLTSNLDTISYQSEGTYTITVTIVDNEGCMNSRDLTLIVEKQGGGGGGGKKTGSKPQDPVEPEGEVLGASACTPYLTTFMKMGEANLKEDVVRLQVFLNEYMGETLTVDGVYGQKTFEAVKRFQEQEFDEILKPWGITESTGITRETTTRRINNIMCPELNIEMPILYCATTGRLLFPDGTFIQPDPAYILYNGQPVIKTQVISPITQVLGTNDFQYEK